jgi:hypothetical protein
VSRDINAVWVLLFCANIVAEYTFAEVADRHIQFRWAQGDKLEFCLNAPLMSVYVTAINGRAKLQQKI